MNVSVAPLRAEYEAVDKIQHIPQQTAVCNFFMCVIYSTELVVATSK